MSIRQLPDLACATALAGEDLILPDALFAQWNPNIVADARAAEQRHVISILQPIGQGLFTEGFTAQRMSAALRAIGPVDVEVHINSPGGRIDDGTAIYNMLRQHKGKVTVKILGMAGSIASVIAMAGDRIEIAKAGFVFVHNGEVGAIGNKHVFEEVIARLNEFDAMMANVYADRTGQSVRDVEKLLDGAKFVGTLMNSTVALDKGFADALLPGDVKTKQGATALARDVLAVRRIEELATTASSASRGDVRKLLKEIKAGIAGLETGTPGAAEDTTRDAGGVSVELAAVLARISIP